MPVLGVAGRRRLLGQPQTLLKHLTLDRAGQIQPPAHAPGRGQQLIRGEVQQHARKHPTTGGVLVGVTSFEPVASTV
jgi:hypothetical protein